jgi:hypothetical protein
VTVGGNADILQGMEHTTLQPVRSIDVTGLPDEAIRTLESLVNLLRGQKPRLGGTTQFSSREEWIKAVREWAASHSHEGTSADWSRESIYEGRGE